jgi:RNA polymerase sigma factor (sigma-70 family)
MASGQLDGVVQRLRTAALGADCGKGDGELLASFLGSRDEAAFEALVRRHGPMVLAVCRRVVRSHHDAEDAFQATFLVLVRKASSIARRELLANWLHGVAFRAAHEVKAARRGREEQVNEMPEPGVVDEADDWSEIRPILDEELNNLPEIQRVPILLCDLQGMTRREAARAVGVPEGTLSGRLTAARRVLAERLARRGVALSALALAVALSQNAASAAVPASLAVSTSKAAAAVAAGGALTSAVSAQVAAITEGVLKSMLMSKLKGLAPFLVVAFLLLGTALTVAFPATADEPEEAKKPASRAKPQPAILAVKAKADTGGDIVHVKTDTVLALAYSPDGRFLAGGGFDQKVRLWAVSGGKLARTLEGPKETIRHVGFSKDGKTLVAGADDGTIYLWDVKGGKVKAKLPIKLPSKKPGGKRPLALDGAVFVNSILFLPDGKLAALYNYTHEKQETNFCRIVIWDIKKAKPETLYEERGNSYGLALSPDRTVLAATLHGDSNGVKGWELKSRKVVWELSGGPDFMSAVAFSPDGKSVAVGGGHSVEVKGGFRSEGRLWFFDVATKKLLWDVKEPKNWAYSCIAFTRDGTGLITGSSGAIKPIVIGGARGSKVVSELRRWDASKGGKLAWKSEGELGGFNAIAVSPDGKTVAGSDDAQLMLFDANTGAQRSVVAKVKN